MTKDVAIVIWLTFFAVAWAAYSVGWRVGNNKAKLEAETATCEREQVTWGKAIDGFGTGVDTVIPEHYIESGSNNTTFGISAEEYQKAEQHFDAAIKRLDKIADPEQ